MDDLDGKDISDVMKEMEDLEVINNNNNTSIYIAHWPCEYVQMCFIIKYIIDKWDS